MSTPNPYVVETMKHEIAAVKRQVWRGLPDQVCNPTTERKQRGRHEALSMQQAELCQQTYLTTARARLAHYLATGEIRSHSVPTQLAF